MSTTRGADGTEGDDGPELSFEDPFLGQLVADKYRVLARLGEGGMAVVYEAENVAIKKRVALKIAQGRENLRDDFAARFTREIEASSKVEHPHVAAAFDGGTLPTGEPYLVSQLLRGRSLHERLGDGPIPWKEACSITAQIADALSAIHAAGFVHRDLTPANIQLSQSSTGGVHVFVFDLGIAAPIDRDKVPSSAFKTTIGAAVGTPGYMSPEQAVANPVSARSDLYVLGLLFFEMLTGKPVFRDELPLPELLKKQLAGDLELPSPSETGLPAELDAMARQLLSIDPSGRPPDATAVRWAFSAMAGSSATAPPSPPAAPSSPAAPSAAPSPPAAPSAAPSPPAAPSAAPSRPAAPRATSEPPPEPEREASPPPAAPTAEAAPRVRTPDAARGTERSPMAIGGALLLGAAFAGTALFAALGGPSEPEPAVVAVPDAGPVDAPVALSEVEDALLHGRAREREEAASTVLSAEDGAYPRYARLVAAMTLARGCEARLAQIQALGALGDARALPALERIDRAPRTGCGRREREDCHACARDALATALAAIEGAHGAPP